jgi:hypothetical protein
LPPARAGVLADCPGEIEGSFVDGPGVTGRMPLGPLAVLELKCLAPEGRPRPIASWTEFGRVLLERSVFTAMSLPLALLLALLLRPGHLPGRALAGRGVLGRQLGLRRLRHGFLLEGVVWCG